MKELYFSRQSLEQQALQMYQQAIKTSRKKRIRYQPNTSALLVLDMQEYFLSPASHAFVPSAEAIVGGINKLIDAYFFAGRPIIFSQHGNTMRNAGMMSTWWNDMLTPQDALHRIIPDFDVTKGRLLQKNQYDAFYRTKLEGILRQEAVKQVVICGVMTHLCCETTARSAFMRGFEVFFTVDGTATYNRDFHLATLTNLAHGFAEVVLVKDILEAVRGDHES
jgi:bifunctional isochorismate lyase/aryl carrier protein